MVGGLVLREERDGDRLLVKASGPLTMQTAAYLRGFIATHLRRRAASVVVADLSQCVHMLTDDDLSQLGVQASSGPERLTLPLVLVVPAICEEVCERYCARAARLGLLRMCYVTLSDALEWASAAEDWPS